MGRVLHLLAVALLATLAGYAMVDALPGDAALARLGEQATPAQLAALRADLGLDRPLPLRYVDWLLGALRGDLGISPSGTPVAPLLLQRFAVSLELMLLTQAMALLLAVPAALLCAARPQAPAARLVSSLALLALSTPAYVFALLLLLLFAVWLDWLPAGGFVPFTESPGANLRSLLLPAATLALVEMPVYLRVLRQELVAILGRPWIRTARAFGAGSAAVLLREALRPGAVGLVTVVGLNVGHLIAGAVVVETIFAVPGLGRTLLDAILARDTATLQGAILLVAASFVLVNLAVDRTCRWLDPRTREQG